MHDFFRHLLWTIESSHRKVNCT